MSTRNAAVLDGIVVDVGRFDIATPPARSDGATWMRCEVWVEVGCLYNGSAFRLPDSTKPPKDHVDALEDQEDKNEMLEKLLVVKATLPDMRNGVGSNPLRIERLEDAVVVLIRDAVRRHRQ